MCQAEYNPCAACHQRCCRDYTVAVIGRDAWLIATRLQLAMEQFLVYFPADANHADGFKLDHSETSFQIALAQKQDEDGGSACIFWLALPEGYRRCGVYSTRPFVCQTYPAFLSDGMVHLRTDVPCPPRSWNLATMNLPSWSRRLLRFQMEYDIYRYIVEQWNRFVSSSPPETTYPIGLYYSYLMGIYGRLAAFQPANSTMEEGALLDHWRTYAEQRANPLQHPEAAGHRREPVVSDYIDEVRETIDAFLVHPVC